MKKIVLALVILLAICKAWASEIMDIAAIEPDLFTVCSSFEVMHIKKHDFLNTVENLDIAA